MKNLFLVFCALIVSFSSFAITITGPDSVCIGTLISLSTSPLTAGTWSSSNTAVATAVSGDVGGVSQGVVTITFHPASVGTGGMPAYLTVTVNPVPDVITGPSSVCVGATITLSDDSLGGAWTSSATDASVGSLTGVVTGVSSGTTVITYSLPTQCYTTMMVTVNPSSGGPITGITGICAGSTTTLNCTPAGGSWSSSNTAVCTAAVASGVISGISPGTSTITYIMGASCPPTATVTVNPLPAAIGGPSDICKTHSVTLTDVTSGGTWSSGASAVAAAGPTGIISGITAGTATITYMLGTGCSATRQVTVQATPCVSGVTVATNDKTVTIFPNPVTDELTIEMEDGEYSSFTITNSIGQLLMQQQLYAPQTNVDVKGLPSSAIYYITFRGDNGTNVQRFIKM